MAFAPLFALFSFGVLVIGALTFWSAVQNWLADLIQRTQTTVGATHTLQSALVVVDRVVVNGQRVALATARTVFRPSAERAESLTIEEVRTIAPEDLPAEVAARLDANQPVSYELAVGTMQVQGNHVTHKLVVRRAD